mmetsp:Transcript_14993/g.52632  ORF Transcript_14993/g.52632 Transcript_14993/m.52632 type:complete len:280 (+) Transcript_14993:1024-1863(+)
MLRIREPSRLVFTVNLLVGCKSARFLVGAGRSRESREHRRVGGNFGDHVSAVGQSTRGGRRGQRGWPDNESRLQRRSEPSRFRDRCHIVASDCEQQRGPTTCPMPCQRRAGSSSRRGVWRPFRRVPARPTQRPARRYLPEGASVEPRSEQRPAHGGRAGGRKPPLAVELGDGDTGSALQVAALAGGLPGRTGRAPPRRRVARELGGKSDLHDRAHPGVAALHFRGLRQRRRRRRGGAAHYALPWRSDVAVRAVSKLVGHWLVEGGAPLTILVAGYIDGP